MTDSHYWTACHTQPGAEWKAREGIEKAGFGTFLPAYAKQTGQKRRYHPIMPSYVMVAIDATNERNIGEIHKELIEGVDKILGRVSEQEIERLRHGHIFGSYNVQQARNAAGRFTATISATSKKRRRPRPLALKSRRAQRRRKHRERMALLRDFTGATNQVAL